MDEIKKNVTVANYYWCQECKEATQRTFGEKENFQRKVCICECPDTLKHTAVACDGYMITACMVPWLRYLACVNVNMHHIVIGIANCE